MRQRDLVVLALILFASAATAQDVRILQDFEDPADLRIWEIRKKSAQITDVHVTQGRRSLKISSDEYLACFRLPRDWSGFDALEIDVFVEGDNPVGGSVLIADEDWKSKGNGSYWNRHNGSFNLRPGANTLSIAVQGLYRGEAGSRNNDLKYNIKPDQIIRFDIGFSPKGEGVPAIYLDNMRLTKESRPKGILAFDFGPESQAIFPGFTPIAPSTVYGRNGATAGLKSAVGVNSARDDTFPTRLYRDYVSLDWNAFVVDVPDPAANYHAWVVFDDLGYWGGEQASFRVRKITCFNEVAFSEDRGPAGPAEFLYRFESTEPGPGDNIWDLYMAPLFAPRRFAVKPRNKTIELRFETDGVLGSKVAAIVLYPDSIKDEAEKWLAGVEKRNRDEFESRAVALGPKPKQLDIPGGPGSIDYWLGVPSLEDEITFYDAPGAPARLLRRTAARGQRISATFAIRPFKDYPGPVTLSANDLTSPAGTIPASAIDVRYVHHALRRGFNDIAYVIAPESLRPVAGSKLALAKDRTRQFWITIDVPAAAKPGVYQTALTLSAGSLKVAVPLTIEVLPFTLDEPDFLMGFFGASVPRPVLQARGDDAWRDLLRVMRENGMNSFSGGPGVKFSGLDASGKPILDFAACDQFMKLAREAGFSKSLVAYGGPGMVSGLHDSYVIGETGRAWERKTGKPFGELLAIVWTAVRDHAREQNWLPVMYEFTDEPRVLEQVTAQLELMKLYRRHAPWVDIGGSYSVKWDNSPLERGIQEIFTTLNWSSLNLHTQADLDKARELGKHLHIYNQGRSRYSFGAYQWAEMHKGIRGRMQWHLLALHGYQFFDLDGREPDTAMINWTTARIVPTIHLHRCREGSDDFRFAVTLWNAAQKKKDTPAGKAAIAWLEGISQQIPLNQNTRPNGFIDDEAFRAQCIERLRLLGN